ncbi:MAG: hypothetical protein ACREL3_13375, partial [Gemmatimonadales bacterium]
MGALPSIRATVPDRSAGTYVSGRRRRVPATSTTESSVILSALLALQQAVTPGPQIPYWQQEVAYEISARLDEPAGVLGGTERIHYHNRSPDTLETFSLHLYLNAFRPGSRWADADSVEGRRRFNDLRDPDFAFNHVRAV